MSRLAFFACAAVCHYHIVAHGGVHKCKQRISKALVAVHHKVIGPDIKYLRVFDIEQARHNEHEQCSDKKERTVLLHFRHYVYAKQVYYEKYYKYSDARHNSRHLREQRVNVIAKGYTQRRLAYRTDNEHKGLHSGYTVIQCCAPAYEY